MVQRVEPVRRNWDTWPVSSWTASIANIRIRSPTFCRLTTTRGRRGPCTPPSLGVTTGNSAVHSHWCLVRLIRVSPQAAWATSARAALQDSLTQQNIDAEVAYLSGADREAFERPYGLAWLLQLAAELCEWDDTSATHWLSVLNPLEELAIERFSSWLPKLSHPIRSGEHSQTAFAMGLAMDWAKQARNNPFHQLLDSRAIDFYLKDRGWPISFEPSGHDFLSPSLAEADLMRRVLAPDRFAKWLDEFLPEWSTDQPIEPQPVTTSDASDGKLAHLDGLNLSRAWMLEGIVTGLPKDDRRIPALNSLAQRHRDSGVAAVTGEHYAGSHWLASFAMYLLSGRGIE